MLAGSVSFPGLTNIALGAEMIFSRGPYPSSCLIRTLVEPSLTATVGTLAIGDDDGNVVQFPEACVNRATLRHNQGAKHHRWSVQVWDRRWKWAGGQIEGEYNTRLRDGLLKPATKRTARELAHMLLQAMGETGFDVTAIPNNAFPPITWKCANPALALEELANLFACTIVLGLDNQVRIVQVGVGDVLTDTGDEVTYFPFNLIPSRVPSGINICMGDVRWQLKWELEPVGLEPLTDELRHINDLSYKPAGGWGDQWWCEFAGVDPAYKPLAHKYVWRWWRVRQLAEGGYKPDKCPFDVTSIEQHLPIEPTLLKSAETPTGSFTRQPFVEGRFWTQGDMPTISPAFTRHSGDFKIHGEMGVVEFEYPVLYLTNGTLDNAVLYLTASSRMRGEDGKEHASYGYGLELGGQGKPQVVRHPELALAILHEYDGSNLTGSGSNKADVDAEAAVYASALARPYQSSQFQDVTYQGIKQQRLDGAIAQIQWRVGLQHGCQTRISRMHEFSPYAADAVQRGRKEKVDAI